MKAAIYYNAKKQTAFQPALKVKRKKKRPNWTRQLYAREQLSIYDIEAAREDFLRLEQYARYLLTERGCRPATIKSKISVVRQFVSFLQQQFEDMDPFRPDAVTPGHVRRYLAYLKNELNNIPSTRNGKLTDLKSYYYFLECFNYLDEDDNPLQLIRRARVPSRLPVCLTLEEAEKILAAAASGPNPEQDVAILRVMLQAGLRVKELLQMKLRDIDFSERTLLITGKRDKQRLVPLTENTILALKDYLHIYRPDPSDLDAALFPAMGGTPGLNKWFRSLCEAVGVQKPGLTVRNLRHTCLTLLLQEGADLMALKKLAGHSRLSVTQRYIHVTQNQLRQAIKKFPLG